MLPRKILLFALLAGAASPPLLAQETPPADPAPPAEPPGPAGPAAQPGDPNDPEAEFDEEDEEGETIVVTGQRQRGAVIGDIPPEVQLDRREIRALGAASLSELLDAIAPQTRSGRGRDGGRPVILLNGRRISGFSEIRDIPPEAIVRIDVMPEEVALKYGYRADQRVSLSRLSPGGVRLGRGSPRKAVLELTSNVPLRVAETVSDTARFKVPLSSSWSVRGSRVRKRPSSIPATGSA